MAYFRAGKQFRDEEHRKAWLLRTTINMSRRITSSSWQQKSVPLSEREDVPFSFSTPLENEVWQAVMGLDEVNRTSKTDNRQNPP